MDFAFTCPECSTVLEANDGMEGMVADCPSCGKQVTVQRRDVTRGLGSDGEVVLRTGWRGRDTVRYRTVTSATGAFLAVQRFRNGQPLGEETQLPMDRISAVELYAGETLGGYAIRKVKAVLLFVAGLGFLTFLAVFLFGLDWYQPGRIPASVSFVGVGMEHADSAYVPLSCRNELATLERFLLANTRLRVLRKSNAGALGSALQVVGLLLAFLGLSFAVWSAQPIRELRTLKMVADIPRSGEFGQEFPHLSRTLRAMGIDLYAPGTPAPAYLESKIRQHC